MSIYIPTKTAFHYTENNYTYQFRHHIKSLRLYPPPPPKKKITHDVGFGLILGHILATPYYFYGHAPMTYTCYQSYRSAAALYLVTNAAFWPFLLSMWYKTYIYLCVERNSYIEHYGKRQWTKISANLHGGCLRKWAFRGKSSCRLPHSECKRGTFVVIQRGAELASPEATGVDVCSSSVAIGWLHARVRAAAA